jgi:hypothetical protein
MLHGKVLLCSGVKVAKAGDPGWSQSPQRQASPVCSGVVVVEYRRRRFVSVSRTTFSTSTIQSIDAICEEGRAWWLAIESHYGVGNWTELLPLPEIEVEVAEQPAAEPSPTAEVISNLLEQMQEGSLTLAQALAEFRDRSPVSEPAPTPEAAPVATDEELLESAAKALGYKHIPSDETCLTAEAGELLVFARAILARWVHPTPPAPEPGEVSKIAAELLFHVAFMHSQDKEGWPVDLDLPPLLTRAAALLEQLPEPAPPPPPDAPAGGLVERVGEAMERHHVMGDIEGSWDAQARAAIREVADWLKHTAEYRTPMGCASMLLKEID